MTQTQVIEGTIDEITTQLRQDYAGQKLHVFVEPETDEEDLAAGLADPPFTVRSRKHLLELLRDGINSPTHEVTEATWERLYERVRNHPTPGQR